MLAHNLKNVIVLVDKDRVKSGRFAIEKWQVDTLLLDDGFQYLHLKHRLDIVLVDRQAPFGNEFLLPRGTLRETPGNLRRASYIFITKNTGEPNDDLMSAFGVTIAPRKSSNARISRFICKMFYGRKSAAGRLRDTFIGSLCAIAAPQSFEAALQSSGRVSISRSVTSIITITPRRN